MKLSFVIAAPLLALAAPAAAQQAGSTYMSTGPWSTGWQTMSFNESVQGRDYRVTSIDQRNSERYWTAKMAWRARQRAERAARRAAQRR